MSDSSHEQGSRPQGGGGPGAHQQRRADKQASSCTECRRRKQKVWIRFIILVSSRLCHLMTYPLLLHIIPILPAALRRTPLPRVSVFHAHSPAQAGSCWLGKPSCTSVDDGRAMPFAIGGRRAIIFYSGCLSLSWPLWLLVCPDILISNDSLSNHLRRNPTRSGDLCSGLQLALNVYPDLC